MKKSKKAKVAVALLSSVMAVSAFGALTACGGGEEAGTKTYPLDLTGVYAYALEQGYTGTYEELVTLVKGPQGEAGKDGEDGKDGKDGAVWLTGEGAPEATAGVVDDMYLDTASGEVYKKGESWEKVSVIKGSDGEQGVQGEQGERGTGWTVDAMAPVVTEGYIEGDMYLDSSSYNIYSFDGAEWKSAGNVKGETVTVTGVSVTADGKLVYTYSDESTVTTAESLMDILGEKITQAVRDELDKIEAAKPTLDIALKVSFKTADGQETEDDILDADYETITIADVKEGSKITNPLAGENADQIREGIAEYTKSYTTWWYKTSEWTEDCTGDEGWARFDFNQPVYGITALYARGALSETATYNINYSDTELKAEGVHVYGSYADVTEFKSGDQAPDIMAFSIYEETTEATEEGGEATTKKMLKVFDGWQTVDPDGNGGTIGTPLQDNTIIADADVTLAPHWKVVDYGYVTEGLTVSGGKLYCANASGEPITSYNTYYTGTDDFIIISGDDITEFGNNKFFNSKSNVKKVYVITPKLNKFTNTGSNGPFKGMQECEGVVVYSDVENPTLNTYANFFDGSAKLKVAALDFNMTALNNYAFRGCEKLESVYLRNKSEVNYKVNYAVTAFGSYAFDGCKNFDVVKNFGWDALNHLTSIGTSAFDDNETFTEIVIDGDHFSGLTSISAMFNNNPNVKSCYVEWYKNSAISSAPFGTTGMTGLESVEVYAPFTTSLTLSCQNAKELNKVRVYAPNVTTFSGSLDGTNVTSAYVTDDVRFHGDEDAVVIVGKITKTDTFFKGAKNLKTVVFDVATVTDISYQAFQSCTNLTRVTFNSGNLQTFGNSAFNSCNKLRAIIFPELAADDTRQYRTGGTAQSPTYTGLNYVISDCYQLEYISNLSHFQEMFKVLDTTLTQGHGFPRNAPLFRNGMENGLLFVGSVLVGYDAETVSSNLVIPAKTEAIVPSLFNRNTTIESVSFAGCNRLTSMGSSVFAYCPALKSVDMSGATALVSGTEDNGNTGEACANMFEGCEALATVKLPDSASFTDLPNNMFASCSSLTEITIPASVITLGNGLFNGCKSLHTKVGQQNEDGTTNQGVVFAGEGKIEKVGNYLFQSVGVTDATDLLNRLVTAMKKDENGLVDLSGALSLFAHAGYDTPTITKVVIPACIKSFGDRTFDGQTKLATVKYAGGEGGESGTGDNLTSFASNMFNNGVNNITEFVVPAHVTSVPTIGNNLTKVTFLTDATTGKSSVTNVDLGGAVLLDTLVDFDKTSATTIDFSNCKKLTSISLPSTLTNITSSAFKGSGLTSMDLSGSGVTGIGGNAFENCTALASVTLPSGLTSIGNNAFKGCTKLTSIDFSGCSKIASSFGSASSLFENCTALTEVKLPSGLTKLGASTFKKCSLLTSIDLPATVNNIGSNALEGTAITSFVCNAANLTLGSSVFKNCKQLTHIDIPKITSVGSNTFEGTAITSFTTTATTLTLGSNAFNNCKQLTYIDIPAATYCSSYKANYNPFYGCTALTTIRLGSGTKIMNGTKEFVMNNTSNCSPWYWAGKDHAISIVIAASVTEVGDNAFCNAGSASNYSFYFEGANKFADVGSGNGAYTMRLEKNDKTPAVFTEKGTNWDYKYGTYEVSTDPAEWVAPTTPTEGGTEGGEETPTTGA